MAEMLTAYPTMCTRREFLGALGGSVVAFCTPRLYGSAASSVKPSAPPNIVLVLIDDMGWADLSCFGGRDVVTENIDRLAREGLRFEQFYVNSPIWRFARAYGSCFANMTARTCSFLI
jgi:hypothetical protein